MYHSGYIIIKFVSERHSVKNKTLPPKWTTAVWCQDYSVVAMSRICGPNTIWGGSGTSVSVSLGTSERFNQLMESDGRNGDRILKSCQNCYNEKHFYGQEITETCGALMGFSEGILKHNSCLLDKGGTSTKKLKEETLLTISRRSSPRIRRRGDISEQEKLDILH